MKKNTRSVKKSIRVREDIYEIAEQICREHGYSHADIYEMGVLLIDNNNEQSLILKEQIFGQMIDRFEELSDSIHKDCNNMQDKIIQEINKLKSIKDNTSKSLDMKNVRHIESNVGLAVEKVIELINRRESLPEYKKIHLEPIGREYYSMVCEEFAVPMDLLLNSLSEKGYTSEKLLELGMNPEHNWKGYKQSDDQMFAKKSKM